MARFCDQCLRGTTTSQTRSHSNIASKRKVNLNLQVKRINGQRLRMCTRCLRTMMKKVVA